MKHTQSKIKLGKKQEVFNLIIGDYFIFAVGKTCQCIRKVTRLNRDYSIESKYILMCRGCLSTRRNLRKYFTKEEYIRKVLGI